METLGIYGDSFAKDWKLNGKERHIGNKEWSGILKQNYNVINYGMPGSSLYYSYEKFIGTYFNFDKIVFIVTDLNRAPNCLVNHDGVEYGMNSIETLNRFKENNKNKLSDDNLLKLQAIEYYYAYLNSNKINFNIATLMIQEIKKLRPDALIIPTTANKICAESTNLLQYQKLAVKSLKPDYLETFNRIGYIECKSELNLQCHLTEEINVMFAQHVKEALQTGKWDPTLPDTLAHKHDWNYYYT
jgi:hypothetical protein